MNLDHYSPDFNNNTSTMEWAGSRPRRFSGGKIHYQTRDNFFGSTIIVDSPMTDRSTGKRFFYPKYGAFVYPRSSIKTYSSPYQHTDRPQGIRTTRFTPLDVKPRPERQHNRDDREQKTVDELPIGIKTYYYANQDSDKHYYVEDKMQRKIRVRKLDNKKYYYGALQDTRRWHHYDFGASVYQLLGERSPRAIANLRQAGSLTQRSSVANDDERSVRELDSFRAKKD